MRIRVRLDNFYRLAEDALCFTYCKEGFGSMNVVLCTELEDLCKLLNSLEAQYKGELPLVGEEPQKICWADEKKVIDTLASKNVRLGDEQRCFSSLVKSWMEEVGKIMGSLEKEMDAEYDPQTFASYGKRSLQEYNKVKWNPKRREVQAMIMMVSEVRQKMRCEVLLKEYIGRLNGMSDLILAENGEVIYYEALGRFIWHSVHNDAVDEAKVDELLCLVKTIEYLCGRLDRKLTFLDKETKNSGPERDDYLREQTLQNQCGKASFRLNRLEEYLQSGFTVGWIKQMLDDMVKSEHSVLVCHKMRDGKLAKFVHQIAGVLIHNNVLDGCTYDDVVKALDYSKPKKQSRKDYVRHMIDDKELQKWLENYIADFRKSKL